MKSRRAAWIALAFLLPNLLGFLVFTLGPILYSLWISMSDWALTRQNDFNQQPINFIGVENYTRLLVGDESVLFWDYFGNTVFLMLGIPVGIAGSLLLALILNTRTTPRRPARRLTLATGILLLTVAASVGTWVLTNPGPPPADTVAAVLSTEEGLGTLTRHQVDTMRCNGAVLLVATLGGMTFLGVAVGSVFFRTVYYLPSLLAGVAMYLLWKALFRPRGGLINAILGPPLDTLQSAVESTPDWLWYALGITIAGVTLLFCLSMLITGIRRLSSGEAGMTALLGRLAVTVTLLAAGLGIGHTTVQLPADALLPNGVSNLATEDISAVVLALDGTPGVDTDLLAGLAREIPPDVTPEDAIAQLAPAVTLEAEPRLRAAAYAQTTPTSIGYTAGDGLQPPEWLISSRWAKTAIVIMGIWLGIGGSNMLLYLAGLSNIPPELYEAAAIDGAAGWKRFINVTWPQLAPTTFFIVIMSTIGGLQGGF
ncbi:MAG: sugar ABC transporter permease, partial [Phycisphaerales bacterium]|nr:sugar ABC transporter permease [Phycisphaerales bacterium]